MRRLTNIILTALVAFAGLSGVAAAQDLRSPDARQGIPQVSSTKTDLRSPDARDSSRQLGSSQTDLRSPDARDVSSVATYTPGRSTQVAQPIVQVPANGFSWGDAGIGAAGMLALVTLAAGALLLTSQRRRSRGGPVAMS